VYQRRMMRLLARVAVTLSLLGAAACGASQAQPEGGASLAGKKPGEVYTAYVSAIGNAVSLQELHPYLSRAALDALPKDLEAVKARVPAGVLKIPETKVEGDRATILVHASMAGPGGEVPSTGTITLVREGGVWKVDKETWKAK
jgi:hypothetical protein